MSIINNHKRDLSSSSSDNENEPFVEHIHPPKKVPKLSPSAATSSVANSPHNTQAIRDARRYLKREGSLKFIDRHLPENATAEDLIYMTKLLGFDPFELTRQFQNNPETNGDNSNDNDSNDNAYLEMAVKALQIAIHRVETFRARLTAYRTVESMIDKIRDSKNILVITGAGISTSLGIPDFRSSKGFYSRLGSLGLSDPQDVFDLQYFYEEPSIFYSIANMVLPPENVYTPLHSFIKLLSDKGKLLRNYTQNIDDLESVAGIPSDKIIQCHGSFATASCVTCNYKVKGNTIFKEIREAVIPYCPKCSSKRKQLIREDRLVYESYGVMKPDITFFGEDLPELFHRSLNDDLKKTDLLISIGTSLKVAPVSEIVNKIGEDIPQLLINKDPVTHCNFDVSLLGYCDTVAEYLCEKLGWKLPLSDGFEEKKAKGEIFTMIKCALKNEDLSIYDISSKEDRIKELERLKESQQEEKEKKSITNEDGSLKVKMNDKENRV